MRIIVWLFRAFLFFSLAAFALNNQQVVSLNWFFGYAWTARMVIIVLGAFVAGIAVGVFAMMPSWWAQRRLAQRHAKATAAAASPAPVVTPQPDQSTAPLIDGI